MWYVIGSLNRQNELRIRDTFCSEGYACFVPLRYDVVRKQRRLVPAIPGMVFLKGELEELLKIVPHRKERVFLRKSTFSNHEDYLTVSDHDMENFIAVTEKAGERITYYEPGEIQLRPGDRIRVNGGLYDGREGVIMRVKGKRKKQLVVSIPGFLVASVEMEPELIELVSPEGQADPQPGAGATSRRKMTSKDVDADKALVLKLSKRLLFEIPTSFQHEKEYYLLLSELKRAASRLSTIKGYIPSQEAELALPLYLAAFKLQQGVEGAEARLRQAISKLQDTSLLKLRCQMYLGVLSEDAELLSFVEDRISSIKSSKLSIKQRVLLEEYEKTQKSL